MKNYTIAVIGATGVVGEIVLELLHERNFPVDKVVAIASEESAGKRVAFDKRQLKVQAINDFDFSKIDIAFFCAGRACSKQYVPVATNAGCVVIDNSAEFRQHVDVPLVVPEVNPEELRHYANTNIIANPNCSTIQMLVALKPIYDAVGIERINVSTYQAVSGAGRRAISELAMQTSAILNGQTVENTDVFNQQIAFNVIPQIDEFDDNGYTFEEIKMVQETQKILNNPDIKVNPTAVRVPVFYGHSEAVHIETRDAITVAQVKRLLKAAHGVQLLAEDKQYPTALSHAVNEDHVFVGRIRQDLSSDKGINLWIVADNARKGAALNAVQIAELLIKIPSFQA